MGRIFTLVLLVLISLFVGVTIALQQANNPIMLQIASQESEILDLVRRMDRLLVRQQGALAGVQAPSVNTENIERQLAALNKKVDSLEKAVKNIKVAQPPKRPTRPPEDLTTVHEIPIDHSPIKGNKKAPITIVAFDDFQCPFCARFHPVLSEVLEAYPKKVKVVIKHFPLGFHKQAKSAAKAAFAAGEQKKYWEMVDLLLENARNLSPEKYEELAKSLKLNMKKFRKALEKNDAKYEEWIKADMQLGSKVGVRGTPTFYLNGRKTRARTLDAYKKEIDAILKEKKK